MKDTYLILLNWKMLNRINSIQFSKFKISRLLIILVLCIGLFLYSIYTGFEKDILISFFISIFLIELLKVNQKCFFDPSHFLLGKLEIQKLGLKLFLIELTGPKIFPLLILFSIQNNSIVFLQNIFLTYVLIVYFQVIFAIIGMRIKIFSIVYVWFLIILTAFLSGFLNITGNLDMNSQINYKLRNLIVKINTTNYHLVFLIIFITLIFTIFYNKWIKENLLPNPESFPKKIL